MELLIFLFGLIIGSFLNVCIVRLPKNQSVVAPRSHCPHCQTPIRWSDNIPVISYIIVKGRCRSCHQPIHPQYWIIELITAGLALMIFIYFKDMTLFIVYFLFLICPLIVMSGIDLRHRLLPDILTIPGIIAGILIQLALAKGDYLTPLITSMIGILTGGGVLFTIAFLYEKIQKREGLGGGDIKLAAMLGAFFGWKGILFILLVSSVLGSLTGSLLIYGLKRGKEYEIPYGPFLAGAAILYLVGGGPIVNWYLKLF